MPVAGAAGGGGGGEGAAWTGGGGGGGAWTGGGGGGGGGGAAWTGGGGGGGGAAWCCVVMGRVSPVAWIHSIPATLGCGCHCLRALSFSAIVRSAIVGFLPCASFSRCARSMSRGLRSQVGRK